MRDSYDDKISKNKELSGIFVIDELRNDTITLEESDENKNLTSNHFVFIHGLKPDDIVHRYGQLNSPHILKSGDGLYEYQNGLLDYWEYDSTMLIREYHYQSDDIVTFVWTTLVDSCEVVLEVLEYNETAIQF